MIVTNPEQLDWDKGDGLLPAIVQDATTAAVLMLGYMSRESLERTLDAGEAVFFSRSRDQLWRKGETSGNVLEVLEIRTDCDTDALLVLARPAGPTCHRGTATCFEDAEQATSAGILGRLEATIGARLEENPEGSYVARIAAEGATRLGQKVGEEGVEFALATAARDREQMAEEGADLLFHLALALRAEGMSLVDVLAVLDRRRAG